ncbi:MAG: hypothetical protein HY288_01275 [Planctomycetia bacterium]|nr:hypothetical protein [Planctomycetia bacterium]
MARSTEDHEANFGGDSFLDVITNFVGILIILVMVVGGQAKQAIDALSAPPDSAELAAARAEAIAAEQDVHRMEAQVGAVEAELAARQAQRNQLNTLITAIEHDLAERRASLDQQSRNRYDFERDLALAKNELAQLENERQQAEQTAAPATIKVESYPTPISKTVDSKEAHFQLIGGRLTFVPFDALVDKLQGAMREYSRKFDEQPELTDTLGPIGGFRMRYSIERFDTPRGSILRVTQIEFLPVSGQLGETIEMALAPESTLREKLKMMSPRQYTITVWTYPDSFAEFRRLKKELYQLGYAVAARPLPMGMPIGASPNGSKSSAE